MIDLLRRKVRLNQPYIGVFLKKDEDNKSEVVQKLSDVYEIGSFAQIQEMQDLGDKLRLVVTAHRRVKIVGQLIEELEDIEGEKGERIQLPIGLLNVKCFLNSATTIKFPLFKTQISVSPDSSKPETDAEKRRRKHRLNRLLTNAKSDKNDNEAAVDGETGEVKQPKKPKVIRDDSGTQPLLMVEVENIQHEAFKQTQEVKALTQEVIKTIRDIITMNPLYR